MNAIRWVESAMTASRTLSACSAPSLGGPAKGGRGIVSGVLGAAFLAAALAFPAGEAWARDECGALSSGSATCSDQAYASGIRYDVTDGWVNGVAGPVTLTVTGGTATTITAPSSPPNTYTDGAIVIRTAPQGTSDSTSRTVVLTVGSGSNAVAIVEDATETNHGVQVHQFGKAADATTVTIGSGVEIGTASAPMRQYGAFVLTIEGTNTAAQTIDSAATIHSANFGLLMDARGAGNVVVKNSGSITTAATGGDTSQKSGIRVLDWSHNPSGNTFGGDSRTATTTTTVTNSGSVMVSAQYAHGVHVTADGLGLYKTVNSGTVSASGGSHGIFVEARYHTGAAGSEAVEVKNSGAITAAGVTISAGVTTDVGGIGIYVETVDSATPAGRGIGNVKIANSGSVTARQSGIVVAANMGDISVTHSGAGTVSSSIGDGIQIQRRGAGEVMVDSSADIAAGRYGIYVNAIDTPAAATTVSAGLTTKPFSTTTVIAAGMTSYTHDWPTATTVAAGTTTTTYATPGAISVTTPGGDIEATGESGIWVVQRGADATVTSSADITARKYGIFVINDPARATMAIADGVTTNTWSNTGAVSVTHSAGDIDAETESGIHAQNSAGNADEVKVAVTGGSVSTEGQSKAAVAVLQRGTGDAVASVSSGAMLISKHNAGVYANLEHAANAAGQVKVTQGGTIAGRKGVYARAGRASAAGETRDAMKPVLDVTWTGSFSHGTTASVAQTDADRFLPTSVANAVAFAQEVETEKAIRYGQAAGIEAQVLSWRAVMTQVAKGDDPGAFADAAAVTALFDSGADAATQARAAEVIDKFRTALANEDLDTVPGAAAIDTDGTTGLSDAEIEAYLMEDSDERRTLLRNVLAQSFTDEEKAVLRAVVTNTGLEAALADEDAGFSDTYKSDVRALLDRYNVGDIRVAMTGGSIASRRGDGIRAYYATPHAKNGAISVTIAAGATVDVSDSDSDMVAGIYVANAGWGADGVLKQSVTVNGTVMGGTDAAVHLSGGGRLMVGEMGRVLAGSSGVAVLVNEPGPAHLTIDGVVRGGRGGAAAVHLTGGGTVVVGTSGRVEANGATRAIRGGGTDSSGVGVELETTGSVQYKEDLDMALARVEGGYGDGAGVTVVEVDDEGDRTGPRLGLRLNRQGEGETTTGDGIRSRTEEAASEAARERLAAENRRLEAERARLAAENKRLKDRPDPGPGTPPPGSPGTPQPGPAPQPRLVCADAADGRCELYEALPSVLLAMNGMLSYAERSSAVRDANGAWARVEGARGKWEAKKAATTGKLSYDHRRGGVRAGVDLGAGEQGRVGVSVHLLNGKAERSGVGDVEVDGMGAGASATWRWGEWYVDAQAGATWYEVGVDSANRGSGALVKEADGLGYTMEVEAGRGMVMGEEGLVVTPRVGVAWSKVGMDDFTFTNRAGTQERVSVEDAHSARGRLGVLVEAEAGMGERSGRLFGSLDVEQEFSEETQVNVGITKLSENELKTEVRPTTMRLGVGGMLDLGENLVLRGTAGYETSGSGTSGYGGGLELNLRF